MVPRHRSHRRRADRKDRLIQTRVAGDLEETLKREAARRRLTVSHLIRNTLEDAFDLVEGVTADVGQLVTGSVELAAAVGRDARRIAAIVRGDPAGEGAGAGQEHDAAATARQPAPAPSQGASETGVEQPWGGGGSGDLAQPIDHVYGWNRVIANRPAGCVRCASPIARGDDALVGLSDTAGPRVWLCEACGARL